MSGNPTARQWRKDRPFPAAQGSRPPRAITPAQAATVTKSQIPALIRWSFLLFVFWMPLEGAGLGVKGAFLSPGRIAGVPFFVACLFAPKLCFRRPSAPVWWFFAYLAVAAIQVSLAPVELRRQAVTVFLTILQLVLFFWIAGNLFRDQSFAGRALRSYAAATIVLALGTLAGIPGFAGNVKLSSTDVVARTTAFNYNPNDVAAMAALAAVMLLGDFLSLRMKRRYRLFAGVAALPLVILLVRTASRAGIVAFLAGLAVFLLPAAGTRRRLVAALLATGVLLGSVFVAVMDPLLEARLGASYYYGDTAGRGPIYYAALGMISERPIAGWGPVVATNQLGTRLAYRSGVRDPHNLLLYLLLEVGIVGTFPFLVGLFLVARTAWRGRKGALGLVPLALITVLLVVNVAHTDVGWKPMWLVLAAAMASEARPRRVRRVVGSRPLTLRKAGVRREAALETGNA